MFDGSDPRQCHPTWKSLCMLLTIHQHGLPICIDSMQSLTIQISSSQPSTAHNVLIQFLLNDNERVEMHCIFSYSCGWKHSMPLHCYTHLKWKFSRQTTNLAVAYLDLEARLCFKLQGLSFNPAIVLWSSWRRATTCSTCPLQKRQPFFWFTLQVLSLKMFFNDFLPIL